MLTWEAKPRQQSRNFPAAIAPVCEIMTYFLLQSLNVCSHICAFYVTRLCNFPHTCFSCKNKIKSALCSVKTQFPYCQVWIGCNHMQYRYFKFTCFGLDTLIKTCFRLEHLYTYFVNVCCTISFCDNVSDRIKKGFYSLENWQCWNSLFPIFPKYLAIRMSEQKDFSRFC